MNLYHLRVFYEVALRGNFTRAGSALHLSQPAVSEHVRSLEGELGLLLVEKVGRDISLTPAGKDLAVYAARLFAVEAEAGEAMEAHKGVQRGVVRVAAGTTPGVYLLPDKFCVFRQRYPGVQLSLLICNSATVANLVSTGEADIGITGGVPAAQPDLEIEALRPDPFEIVTGPKHPLVGSGPVTASQLVRAGLVVREDGSGTRKVLESWLGGQGVSLNNPMVLNNTEAIKRAAVVCLGIAVLPRLAVERELLRRELVSLPVEGPPIARDLLLVVRRHRRHQPAIKAFIDVLSE